MQAPPPPMNAASGSTAGVDRAIFRRLFDLAMPIVGLNVLSVLTLAVDTAMCGRLENAEEALTALGFAGQLIFLLMVAMLGLTVGTVAFIARAHGAGETDRVNHVLHQSILLTYVVSIAVAIVGNLGAGAAMEALGADGTVRDLGVEYLRPLVGLTVFFYLNMLFAAALRAIGNTMLPFMIALFTNVLNIVLNYGLIFGRLGLPAMGVRGAAWGTVIAQAVAVILMVLLLRRDVVYGMRAYLHLAPIDRPLANDLFRVGAPAALDMLVLNIAFLSVVGMLGRVAQVAVAAHGIGLRIQSLAFVPGLGVAQAIGAMVGNALGGGDVREARVVVRGGIMLSTGIATVIGLAIVFGAVPILGIFDVDPATELGRYSLLWMRILGWGMPIVGVHIALIGMLRGAGATNTSLMINIVGTVVIQVPLSWFLGFVLGWGAFGIWVAVPVSFVVRMCLGILAYRRGTWAQAGATI
ncbi:MAG: MATE family efflux transporter [Myxococcales bacterium]|nr:MAG: MATE family efflux transporter [Myxococcales bacterium]